MTNWRSDRLDQLPPYLFVEIDRHKREAIEAGRDVIDFGIGDPDQPTASFIIDRVRETIGDADNHRYASSRGTLELRTAFADFYRERFHQANGVGTSPNLDPDSEVLVLLGAKEGIGHLPLALLNPGDIVLVPDPGYPVYVSGTVLAGGRCHAMPLRERSGWLPDFDEIPSDVARSARLMWLNYPNNPTTALAPLAFFETALEFAREYDLLIAQDAAYSEVYFDEPPASILQIPGAKDHAIEFHSLSKTFNMTGWRVAFAVGNADALAALATVKSNLDSGVFLPLQHAGVEALRGASRPEIRNQIAKYRTRRDILVNGLRSAGWSINAPDATIYVWAKCPPGFDSMSLSTRILADASVVVVPGVGFGRCGEGFVRFALTVDDERTQEAVDRIAKLSL